jgi:hypothetical protein
VPFRSTLSGTCHRLSTWWFSLCPKGSPTGRPYLARGQSGLRRFSVPMLLTPRNDREHRPDAGCRVPLVVLAILSGISVSEGSDCRIICKREELKGLVVVSCRFVGERSACGGATSAAARGRAWIAYLGFSARFRATRSRCILHCRSRSRRIGMISSSLADPFATIPIMMNRYLLGRWPM